MELNQALNKVLEAREKRAELRNDLALKGGLSLSLTFNIPGYPKHTLLTSKGFDVCLADFKNFLVSNRIFINLDMESRITDEAGCLYICTISDSNLSKKEIKNILERFEETHPLGRIIDVDLFDQNALPISSGKKKPCILCETNVAVECMRNQTHDYNTLRNHIFNIIKDYHQDHVDELLCKELSSIANKALLYEVSLTPKPGLVDFISSGSHEDMNYYTFLNSTSALAPYWYEFAKSGVSYKGSLSEALPIIRIIGLEAEKAMYEATKSINTQKGLIFICGLSLFATAYMFKNENLFSEAILITHIKEITNGIVEKELTKGVSPSSTHGEQTFKKFGVNGAGLRFEAQEGLPIVFRKSLPYIEKNLEGVSVLDRENFERVLNDTLLLIIANLNDTNILYRKGVDVANKLKNLAHDSFENKNTFKELYDYCSKENISSGGSADMLAMTLFFYFIKQEITL